MMTVILAMFGVMALAVSAFCSGAETGFLSVSRGRVLHIAREGGRRAKVLQSAIADIQRTTTTLLVGNNLANVLFSSISAALSERAFPGSATAQAIWGATVACIVLLCGEFMPKLLFSARPLRRMLFLVPAWRVFNRVIGPLGKCMFAAVSLLLPRREQKHKVTPEAVLRILQDRKDGVMLSEMECALISRMMVLRAKGREVTPESLLESLD